MRKKATWVLMGVAVEEEGHAWVLMGVVEEEGHVGVVVEQEGHVGVVDEEGLGVIGHVELEGDLGLRVPHTHTPVASPIKRRKFTRSLPFLCLFLF